MAFQVSAKKISKLTAPAAGRFMQKRTFMEQFLQQPNNIIKRQQEIQQGSTPYLRGHMDPTYWRTQRDNLVVPAVLGLAGFSTLVAFYGHLKLWSR